MIRHLYRLGRKAGGGFEISQLVNLELKLNMLLSRSEGMFKEHLATAALDAAERWDRGDLGGARAALLRGLCRAREVAEDDSVLISLLPEEDADTGKSRSIRHR